MSMANFFVLNRLLQTSTCLGFDVRWSKFLKCVVLASCVTDRCVSSAPMALVARRVPMPLVSEVWTSSHRAAVTALMVAAGSWRMHRVRVQVLWSVIAVVAAIVRLLVVQRRWAVAIVAIRAVSTIMIRAVSTIAIRAVSAITLWVELLVLLKIAWSGTVQQHRRLIEAAVAIASASHGRMWNLCWDAVGAVQDGCRMGGRSHYRWGLVASSRMTHTHRSLEQRDVVKQLDSVRRRAGVAELHKGIAPVTPGLWVWWHADAFQRSGLRRGRHTHSRKKRGRDRCSGEVRIWKQFRLQPTREEVRMLRVGEQVDDCSRRGIVELLHRPLWFLTLPTVLHLIQFWHWRRPQRERFLE